MRLQNLGAIATDSRGNLFVVNGDRIRKITPRGIITAFAGTGESGFGGDNGNATSANLWDPFGIALDPAGNLYIADRSNYRVRKVTPGGIITTAAGGKAHQNLGDLAFPLQLLVGALIGANGDGGRATNASMDPQYVAADGQGSLFHQ